MSKVPADQCLCVDEHGVMRITGTCVMLDSVVAAFWQGHSPETIRQQYPALSLEQTYNALAYYLVNQAKVDKYLDRQKELWAKERAKAAAHTPPVVLRLRAMRSRSRIDPQARFGDTP